MKATAVPGRSAPASWVVLKFGGTSVASVERWLCIERIVRAHLERGRHVLAVCSALSTVTNRLEALADAPGRGGDVAASWRNLLELHAHLADRMGVDVKAVLGADFRAAQEWLSSCQKPLCARDRAHLLAHGELFSSKLGQAFLARRGCDAARVDARELLRSDAHGAGDAHYLAASCTAALSTATLSRLASLGARVVLTQGFVAADASGATVLLGRGGSDASAAYLAAAIGSEAVEIWSDVPGLFTADPRTCADARLVRRVSYAEAETLSALGVKALHPRTIEPLRCAGIPLLLGATHQPERRGTRVTSARSQRGVKAVTSRRELALFVMSRPPRFQPVGFLAAVAACFERRGISMDLVASSPSEIRATVDLAAFPLGPAELERLLEDLRHVCRPRALLGVGSVSLVGTGLPALGLSDATWLEALSNVHVHLTAQGANGAHLTFVVEASELNDLVTAAHDAVLGAFRAEDSLLGPAHEAPPPVRAAAAKPADDEVAA